MGGDAQPQVLLQLLTRLLHHGWPAGSTVRAPRFVLANHAASVGFSTWDDPDSLGVDVEADVPESWADGLHARGHTVRVRGPLEHGFGHAHVITVDDGTLGGMADPRAGAEAAIGL
jgi:gamma-glutamyltranspeptidase/glutathione hydrolase